ncbi:MAG: hypothetical protein V2J24_04315 [Pseudomonadales bacterium]|nr:hypothetical protein [Pseudomonadales bacterium]
MTEHRALHFSLRLALSLCLAALASGCVNTTVKTVNFESAETAPEIAEAQLLDVGIAIFDPAIPEDWEDRESANIVPDVRRAEARYMPQVLKTTLEGSGNWGAVRVLPRASAAVDLAIEGRIVESDGELLEIHVLARDATGRVWIDDDYRYLTSKYAYESGAPEQVDPFQPLYNRIANDLLETFRDLDDPDWRRIRQIAEMRFAQEFAPEAFAGYAEQGRDGRWRLLRLPADDDPMLQRIRRVREREYLFIDTLDEYYTAFRSDMSRSYQDYRRFTYDEAVQKRRLEREGNQALLAGALGAAAATAIAMNTESRTADFASTVAAIGSIGMGLRTKVRRRGEASIHRDAIRELGTQLEGEVTPLVIELDDRTFTLTGTVDEQYERWRGILRDLYAEEQGLPSATTAASSEAAPAAAL